MDGDIVFGNDLSAVGPQRFIDAETWWLPSRNTPTQTGGDLALDTQFNYHVVDCEQLQRYSTDIVFGE